MHVSLLEDVKALGLKGANVEVPDGYALNFLFPQHLAVKIVGDAETDKKMLAGLKSERTDAVSPEQKLVGELDGLEIIIPVPVKNGKLVKPVTATEIRAGLKALGHLVPKNAIKIEAITTLGSEDVPISLGQEFEATVSVVVEQAS